MSAIHREYPEVILCVSTNGLYLPKRLPDIIASGVKSLTVTINSVLPETAERIYSWASYEGKRLSGMDAAECILFNQWQGLRGAVDAGLVVKVNTVLIPGVNEMEIPLIAWQAGRHGAEIMNIMPLIPQAEFSHLSRPSREELEKARADCGGSINQMTHCRQCRADACGLLGEEKDAELEVLNARIGEEYCEMVV
jgi:nitrogen fixation protein NifB